MNISHEQVSLLIERLSGNNNVVAIPKLYIYMLNGDLQAAALLNQIVYWRNKGELEDGWIHKSMAEWTEEIGLKRHSLDRCLNAIAAFGVRWELRKGRLAAPKMHYSIDDDIFLPALIEAAQAFAEEERAQRAAKYGDTVSQKQQIHLPKTTNGFVENSKSLHDTKNTSQNTTNTISNSPKSEVAEGGNSAADIVKEVLAETPAKKRPGRKPKHETLTEPDAPKGKQKTDDPTEGAGGRLIAQYVRQYKDTTGIDKEPCTPGQKMGYGKKFKTVVLHYGEEHVSACLNKFFTCGKQFYREQGYSLGYFFSQLPALTIMVDDDNEKGVQQYDDNTDTPFGRAFKSRDSRRGYRDNQSGSGKRLPTGRGRGWDTDVSASGNAESS